MQVTVNKRVGTVMEWLPNGSVKDLLGNITADGMTLQAAVDAVAWARSTRTPVPPMPPHLAARRVADVFTMPCDVTALEEIGGAAWVRRCAVLCCAAAVHTTKTSCRVFLPVVRCGCSWWLAWSCPRSLCLRRFGLWCSCCPCTPLRA